MAATATTEVRATGRVRRLLVRATVVWLAGALLFWAWYLATQPFQAQLLYSYLWLGLVGVPVWLGRKRLERALARWQLPGFPKFLLLGYAMVLAEEILAALVNNLSEGFSPALYLARIGQFWALNLLAFTGLIVGWYVLLRWIGYSRTEMFYLAGCFGLYSEHTIAVLPTSPLAFVLFAPLITFVYGLILTPAMLSVPANQRRRGWLSALWRYPLAFALPLLCSLPPLLLLTVLRDHYPNVFPPRKFVS